ncbi:hypothetical protein, partial [Accumulibacter sp.]|uniref:hypothetical protein n=1 Tax=Accumulibacter sp. TaxID=2053492 RepID=UPI002B966D5B
QTNGHLNGQSSTRQARSARRPGASCGALLRNARWSLGTGHTFPSSRDGRLPNVVALRSVLTSGAFPATIRTDQIALRGAESCTRG